MTHDFQQLDQWREQAVTLYRWTKKDLSISTDLKRGAKGQEAKLVQELLALHGVQTKIDSDFGPATEHAVRTFQKAAGLDETDIVDARCFLLLVRPILEAARTEPLDLPYPQAVAHFAQRHLAAHPVEVGGDNCGPWVRLYCQGRDGKPYKWCAGFVSFLLHQAAHAVGEKPPFPWTLSCDMLAVEAKKKGRFVAEKELATAAGRAKLSPAAVFLNRLTPTDWVHTGIVTEFGPDSITTVEGNTNDAGDRNGYEACCRIRSYRSRDFIAL